MIVDLRIYTCVPGRLADYMKLYEAEGWPLQQKYLGRCLGWYSTIEGSLNKVVHLWGYDSQADRETRRAAMARDPAWPAFLEKVARLGVLQAQETSMLRPAPFFEAKG